MMLTRWMATVLLMLLTLLAYAGDTQKLSPRMKVVDRDWQYFKDIPCEDIDKIKPYSDRERTLLEKRKSECLNQYKAFFPKAGPKP